MPDDDPWRASPKQLLAARNLRARKRFGQNFLTDPKLAARIAGALPAGAHVIEIGGGTGALTVALLETAARVIVLEIDRDLTALLRERFAARTDRVEIVSGDALQFGFARALQAMPRPRAIVGNLPYNVTTPLLERILESAPLWDSALLMVQREYARRLSASPATPDYGSLTLFAAHYCDVRRLFDVGASGFYPAPNVASTVVRLAPRARTPGARPVDEQLLLRLIRAAFAHRRKTLVNSLLDEIPGESAGTRKTVEAALAQAHLDPMIRAERLALPEFTRLSEALAAGGFSSSVFRRGATA
ncbi:MAG TPA: 16S rRNA (adenine(1518)-N(6)/adenine(1519)-N(6))-dimethyltransferase RsmA [Candidatus Eremiobacteraceae bacterium]|nr:16S rRNA (adenine(1518)-N(6)/adenine(1519)-N(6))-dimethyltransferase RsmA [Candidatus Eremiobacteraceae bacterium]